MRIKDEMKGVDLAKVDLSGLPEVKDGEEVIGKLDNDLVRLYHLFCKARQAAAEMESSLRKKLLEHITGHGMSDIDDEEVGSDGPCEVCAQMRKEMEPEIEAANKLARTSDHYSDIFWCSVRLELGGLALERDLSLRTDGQVIAKPESKDEMTGIGIEILGSFLGSGRSLFGL